MPWARQIRWTELTLMPIRRAIIAAVQCGRLEGRIGQGQRDDALDHFRRERRNARGPGLAAQQARDPFCGDALLPSQTQVFDLPVRRMISTGPTPATLSSTIWARQTCFCGVLRFPTTSSRRR